MSEYTGVDGILACAYILNNKVIAIREDKLPSTLLSDRHFLEISIKLVEFIPKLNNFRFTSTVLSILIHLVDLTDTLSILLMDSIEIFYKLFVTETDSKMPVKKALLSLFSNMCLDSQEIAYKIAEIFQELFVDLFRLIHSQNEDSTVPFRILRFFVCIMSQLKSNDDLISLGLSQYIGVSTDFTSLNTLSKSKTLEIYLKFVDKILQSGDKTDIFYRKIPDYLVKQCNIALKKNKPDLNCTVLSALDSLFFYFGNEHGNLFRTEGMISIFCYFLGENWKNTQIILKLSNLLRNSLTEVSESFYEIFACLIKPLEQFLTKNWENYYFCCESKLNFGLVLASLMRELPANYEEIERIFGKFVVSAVCQPRRKINQNDFETLILKVVKIFSWEKQNLNRKLLASRVIEDQIIFSSDSEDRSEFECLVDEMLEDLN